MQPLSIKTWRVLACAASIAFLVASCELDATRTELADARATAKANEKAVNDMDTSAAITDKATVRQIQAVQVTARAKDSARQKMKEANNDETYRAWAVSPAPDASWRLLREAAQAGSGAEIAARITPGTVPGNADTTKRP